MEVVKKLGGAVSDGNGVAVVYAAVLGAIIANATPVPTDALMFKLQQRDRDLLDKGEITPRQAWNRDLLYYYFFASAYWAVVLAVLANVKGDYQKKVKILSALVGAGFVFAAITKIIEKDNIKYGITKEQDNKYI